MTFPGQLCATLAPNYSNRICNKEECLSFPRIAFCFIFCLSMSANQNLEFERLIIVSKQLLVTMASERQLG